MDGNSGTTNIIEPCAMNRLIAFDIIASKVEAVSCRP